MAAFLKTLAQQRALLDIPRGARFEAYLATMQGASRDIVLPLGDVNPMARDHVIAKLDAWLSSEVEAAAQGWTAEAVRELGLDDDIQVALVVPDDIHGAWTDRDRVDFRFRFEDKGRIKRGFATVQLWASEAAGAGRFDVARRRLRASLYRTAYQRRHGLPKDLGGMLRQEGLALRFSGWPWHTDGVAQETARRIIAASPQDDLGAAFTVLFGDDAGARLGYPARGCPRYAAWDVAVQEAGDPVAALRAEASA